MNAVPAFSRKYQTSCQTCHAIFPKLNPFGEAFRLNGYRMPLETEEQVKQKPVSLGADAYAQMWPEMVYPSDLPGNVPFALNVKMADIYASSHDETGHQIIHNDFQFPAGGEPLRGRNAREDIQLLQRGDVGGDARTAAATRSSSMRGSTSSRRSDPSTSSTSGSGSSRPTSMTDSRKCG